MMETLACGHLSGRTPGDFVGNATQEDGKQLCDKCAHERCLADLTKAYMDDLPFAAYIGMDGKTVTTFTGEALGVVTATRTVRKYRWTTLYAFNVTDHSGRKWQGQGQGEGMYITMRKASK